MLRYSEKSFLQNPPGNSHKINAPVGEQIGLSKLQDYNRIEDQYQFSYPVVQLSKQKLVVYNYHENRKRSSEDKKVERKCDTSKKFTGEISHRTQQKIKHIVESWTEAAKEFKKSSLCQKKTYRPTFTFVTLTLSSAQEHSDNQIKRDLLNHFLIWMQREAGVKNYIWKAESQKNKNIHFHVLADNYIPWKLIRSKWNNIQNKLGYIDRFEKLHGHREPNSTDIHQLKNVQNPAAYISKYICKNQEYRKIEGRVWSCTNCLGNIKKFEYLPDWRTWEIIRILSNKAGIFKKKKDYCTMFAGDIITEIKKYLSYEYKNLCSYLADWWQEQYFSPPELQIT